MCELLPLVDLRVFHKAGIRKSEFEVMQMRIQKIYERGWLSDVEGHYLTALSGPAVASTAPAYWVDLRPQETRTSRAIPVVRDAHEAARQAAHLEQLEANLGGSKRRAEDASTR